MEKKMKLLVTASTFPRWNDDTEPRFVLDLVAHMLNMFEVTVLVPAAPGAKNKEVIEGVQVVRYHYFPIHRWETLCYPGAIVPRIKEKKIRVLLVPFLFISLWLHLLIMLPRFDIVHAHWLIPQGIVQSFFKKPYVVTGHGGDVTSLNKGIFRRLKRRCLKKAKHVTVVSEHLKNTVMEIEPSVVPAVISMGVDMSKFGEQYYIRDYFEQGDKKVVLFVGRLAEKKGVRYLIEAMKQVDALLIIVGDGPMRGQLEEQARLLENRVRFYGAKTHDELKTIYASADVLVVPSITAKDGDQEGIPTTIMEAMASGLPVIASDSGGIQQIIQDGVNGLLCAEKDVLGLEKAIKRVLCSENFAADISYNGKSFIRKYDYEILGEQYSEIVNASFLSN